MATDAAGSDQVLPRVGPLAVYFPFADGALGFHCEQCGYRCCRGEGFGATARELVQLSRHYPTLPMFVQPRREPENPLYNLVNFAPRCYFLGETGLCRIEAEHGRSEKPFVCRAFPANKYLRTEDVLVVDLNFLCPLKPAGPGDAVLRHADVLADLRASIEVPTHLPQDAAALLPEAVLRFESHLRDLPLDEDLLARLALADIMAARWAKPPTTPAASLLAAHRRYLVQLRAEIIRFLGVSGLDPERPRFARLIGLLLPHLRLHLLRASPLDRASLDELLPTLGRPLVALSVYLEIIADLGAEITLQVIDQAFRRAHMLCEMLSRVDRVPQIAPASGDAYRLTLFRTREDDLQRFLQFVHDENPRRGLTLAEIFAELSIDDPAVRAQICQSFTAEALAHFRYDPRPPRGGAASGG